MRGILCLLFALVASLGSAFAGFTDATLDLRRFFRREGATVAIAEANRRLTDLSADQHSERAELLEIKALALGQLADELPGPSEAFPDAPDSLERGRYSDSVSQSFLQPLGRVVSATWTAAAAERRAAGELHWAGRDRFLASMAIEPFSARPMFGPGSDDHEEIDRALAEVLSAPVNARTKACLLLQMAYPLGCNQQKANLAGKLVRAAGDLVAAQPDCQDLLFACQVNSIVLGTILIDENDPWPEPAKEARRGDLALIELLNTLTISRVEQVVEVVKVSRGDLSAIARQAESAAELKQVLAAFTDDELRGLCRTDFLTPRGTSSGSTAWETTLLYGVPVTDDTDEGETEFVPFSLSLGMTTLVRNPSLERALRRGFGAYPIPHHGTMFDYSHAIASLFGVFTIVSGTTDSLDLVSLQRRPEIGPVSNVTMSAVRAATRYGATSPNQLRVEQVGECRELWTNLADAYSAIHLFEFARFSHALHDTKGVDRTAAALTQYDSNFGVSTSVGSVVWNGVIRLLDSGGVTAAAARYDFSGAGATGPWITNLHLGLLSETSDLVQDQEGRRPCLSPPPLPLPAEKAQIGWLQAEALAAAPWRVMSGPLGRSMADRRQFAQDQAVSFRLSNESRPKSIRAAIDFAAMVAKASESDEPAELQRRAQVAADEAALLATSEARLRSLLASDHVIRSATGQLVYELTGDGNSALFDRSDSQVLVVRAMTEISLPPVTQPAAVGEVLGHGEALLTYLVGDTEVVMIVAHNDDGKVSWTSVRTGRAEMEGPVLDCVDALSRSTAVSEASLEQVSRLLLPDKVIEAIGDAKSLIVMPQSFLWRVPFGALKFGQLRLYERMQVGYVESLSLLRQIKSTTGRQGTGDFLSVGGVDPSRAERTSLLDTTGLPVLKLSTDQAKEVVQVVGGVANLQSSEAGVKESLRSARLVHFGTHGVVPPIGRDQVWSALILESGNGDDGLLQPAEIFGAGPFTSLDLVTLIACQSGATQDSMGPFNRAFLYSGAQTVVSTHWAIGEDVGDLFTRKFYGTLAEGKTSFEAMRAAIDAVREQYPEEHHWAPYALYGIGTNRPGKR